LPHFSRKQRLLIAILPPLLALLIRVLSVTLRYRVINAEDTPSAHEIPGPGIYAFWHCSFLACAYHFRKMGIAILISQSFDGEVLTRTVRRLGFHPVRGSSTRGGAAALVGLQEAYAEGRICAFAADGPKGPARIAKYGAVRLAELTGARWIGAFHAQPDRAWILRSWDHFMIPKPFATVTIAWSAHVAPDLASMQQAVEQAVKMATVVNQAPD